MEVCHQRSSKWLDPLLKHILFKLPLEGRGCLLTCCCWSFWSNFLANSALSILGFLPIWGFKTGAGLLGSGDFTGLVELTGLTDLMTGFDGEVVALLWWWWWLVLFCCCWLNTEKSW